MTEINLITLPIKEIKYLFHNILQNDVNKLVVCWLSPLLGKINFAVIISSTWFVVGTGVMKISIKSDVYQNMQEAN